MANIRAIANGNWSNNAIWSPAPPTSVDDVFASGFTVFVDTNIQVISINTIGATGIGGGGTFRPNNGVVMTTNVVAGSTTCVTFGSASPNAFSLVGSVTGGNGATVFGIDNTSSGTINITGNIIAGRFTDFSTTYGVRNNSTGIVNIVGNISQPPNTGNISLGNISTGTINITGNILLPSLNDPVAGFAGAVVNAGSGTINVVGNVAGGNSTSSSGISNNWTGLITIVGNVSAGYGLAVSSGTVGANNGGTGSIRIIGNIYASQNTGGTGVFNGSTGTVAVTGDVYAFDIAKADLRAGIGGSGSHGISNNVGGVVTVLGNVYSGSRSDAWGINNNNIGTVTIIGNVFGNNNISNNTGQGIYNNSTGTINMSGSVFGGRGTNAYGANNNSTGTINISGSAVGGLGTTAYGAFNTSTGILRVRRAVGNGWGLGYTTAVAAVPGVFSNVQGSQTFVEELECGPRGQWPTGGVIFFTPNTKATSMFETDTFQNVTLIESNSADNLVPPVSSVRQGTTYNLGLSTGTCILPPASSVALNTLVDNLTGTAVLTPQTTWNYPTTASDVNSMGGRLRNALNTNSANSLINSFNP